MLLLLGFHMEHQSGSIPNQQNRTYGLLPRTRRPRKLHSPSPDQFPTGKCSFFRSSTAVRCVAVLRSRYWRSTPSKLIHSSTEHTPGSGNKELLSLKSAFRYECTEILCLLSYIHTVFILLLARNSTQQTPVTVPKSARKRRCVVARFIIIRPMDKTVFTHIKWKVWRVQRIWVLLRNGTVPKRYFCFLIDLYCLYFFTDAQLHRINIAVTVFKWDSNREGCQISINQPLWITTHTPTL